MPARLHRHAVIAATAALLALGGCASISESTDQEILVQTIQDNRELSGVGCVLYNDVGKWFVTSPGRVTVRRSHEPLRVDCRKDGASWAYEKIDSKENGTLWGNIVLTAGVGYLVDRNTGAGFDYPSTVTVIMRKQEQVDETAPPPAGVTVY
jgi:hypothetical protein